MFIVSGKLYLKTGTMKKFLTASAQAVALARKSPGCLDFVVAEDPIESDRVNVYEMWESEHALLTFRDSGPDSDMWSAVIRAEVFRHFISSSGPA